MASRTLTDYLVDARRLQRTIRPEDRNGRLLRISMAASFTAKGLKEILTVTCADAGVAADIFESDYNQHWQNLFDATSPLYAHKPDLILLLIDLRDILGEQFWLPYQISEDERRKWCEIQLDKLSSVIEAVMKRNDAKLLLHNFEVPAYSPLGILEDKQAFGVREAVQTLNARLRQLAKTNSRLFIFDYDLFCSRIGKEHVLDHKMYYLGDVRLHWTHMPALCAEYLSYIQPLLSLIRKCIVFDLDNTLWGGIVGEEGMDGIHLGPTPEGRPYWEFQKLLLGLWQRGVVLAINSRNNPDETLRVLREHPFMVLREKHFAAIRINWQDKAKNLLEISGELHLGLDSFVFFDDDHVTRDRIKSAFPEVYVVDLPADAALYPATLMSLNLFNTLQLTQEDQVKGRLYAEQRKRGEAAEMMTLEKHLASLETIVTVLSADASNIPRISQLTQKTNQFNLTTRRYQEEEIQKLASAPTHLVVCCRVQDKFGDNGITGVLIVEKSVGSWKIDTFLLSCRVIGRGVEDALLSYLVGTARTEGATNLIGEFIATAKNSPAKDFYRRKGFILTENKGQQQRWSYTLTESCPPPPFLTLHATT